MKQLLSLPLILSLCFTGCKTIDTVQRTQVGHEDTWISTSVSTDPVTQDWWRIFDDPVLESLIEEAVIANFDIKIAQARIREARATRDAVSGNRLPEIGIGGSAQRVSTSKNGPMGAFANTQNIYSANFDASWELDFFGGNRAERSAADFREDVAVEDQRTAFITVMAEVARNYMEFRGSENRLQILQRNVANQRQTLEIIQKRVELGLSREFDLSRAESQLQQTRSQIPAIRAASRTNLYRLSVLIGQAPETLLDSSLKKSALPLNPDVVPLGLRSDLLQRRPDLRAAAARLAAAAADTGVAQSRLYPRFFLTGSAGPESLTFGDLLESSSQTWAIGALFQWPIFSQGRLRANVRVSEARADQALLEYERSMLEVLEDVEVSMTRYAEELQTRELLQQVVISAQRSTELANSLYESGLSNFIDVLDADRRLVEAEDALAISQTRTLTELVALYKSLGGGWEIQEQLVASNPF